MFHKQKTTKFTLNFPKIIEMHLNSSSQCIQLAMRQVNKQEKNNYGKEKIWELFALTLRFGLTTLGIHAEYCSPAPRTTSYLLTSAVNRNINICNQEDGSGTLTQREPITLVTCYKTSLLSSLLSSYTKNYYYYYY
jgi:hypothetical protein